MLRLRAFLLRGRAPVLKTELSSRTEERERVAGVRKKHYLCRIKGNNV